MINSPATLKNLLGTGKIQSGNSGKSEEDSTSQT